MTEADSSTSPTSEVTLRQVVATSNEVATLSGRKDKTEAIAALLRLMSPGEAAATAGWLSGTPRQGRMGVGWATLAKIEPASGEVAEDDSPTIGEVDEMLATLVTTTGAGSQAARRELIGAILARSGPDEDRFVRDLLSGNLRQGALAGVVTDSVAKAAGVPAKLVRRAAMLSGDLPFTASLALAKGRDGLTAVGLAVGRGIEPMLAATSESAGAAVSELGLCSVEWKLDGARIQVHRQGDEVTVYTRNLNDITARVPQVVEVARSLPVDSLVLDGETLALDDRDRPEAFQNTMSRLGRDRATDSDSAGSADAPDSPGSEFQAMLRPFFFDCLHVDGVDLIDEPLSSRLAQLERIAGAHRIPATSTDDPAEADRFFDEAVAAGHEGAMVKELTSVYAAGRRGKAWRKVKPVHTLDLVVLAVEWGHGRRKGKLSNLHLGARDPDGGFVMVGKTFKGLTDELLAWQTTELLARETHREGIQVHVRPELVVEIALDGVQASTRYPGGVALRFARVKHYRPDKDPVQADTISAVQELL